MRILHTADWHLGHTLHDLPRDHEHARFLEWLLDAIAEHAVEVLIIAGDVFETSNPSAAALAAWYDFMAKLRGRFRDLEVVVVGGNHDSAHRLDAPKPLYRYFGFHVIGGLPRGADGALDLETLLVPLREGSGRVAAWCCAVPFLRQADLPSVAAAGGDPLVGGVRAIYDEVIDAARERRKPGQAIIATGHCYMTGTALSELSERKILGGNQHALPVDIFGEDVAYVALGHLHLAQTVGERGNVRYSGSPIPLSMAEVDYQHQALLIDIEGERCESVRPLPIPRSVEMLRLPQGGPRPLPEVLELLRGLPARGDLADHGRPYLAVDVLLDAPEPSLRRTVEDALEGRAARLVKLTPTYTGHGLALSDTRPAANLADIALEDVFVQRYLRDHADGPPEELLAAFHELVGAARDAEGGA